MRNRFTRSAAALTLGALIVVATACGSDTKAPASTGSVAPSDTSATADTSATTEAGADISLAVNPWTGSAVNANIAKIVLEANLGTKTTLVDIDEKATWPGLDDGSLDAVLEVWPSGHGADFDTYVTGKKSVVEIGKPDGGDDQTASGDGGVMAVLGRLTGRATKGEIVVVARRAERWPVGRRASWAPGWAGAKEQRGRGRQFSGRRVG